MLRTVSKVAFLYFVIIYQLVIIFVQSFASDKLKRLLMAIGAYLY